MNRSTLYKRSLQIAVGLLLTVATTNWATAQSQDGKHVSRIGLGGQIGEPAGVTLKIRNPGATSIDILAAWVGDDVFFVNVHGLLEKHISSNEKLHLFYGPGGYVGFHDLVNEDDEVVAGISATVGLGYMIEQFDLFGQLTPRLDLTPATDGDFGGGIGLRYYF
jgi:hypothetical protein